MTGIQNDSISSCYQRRSRAACVAAITLTHFVGDLLRAIGISFNRVLPDPALCPHILVCIQEDFTSASGKTLRSDVAAFHHDTALFPHLTLAATIHSRTVG